MTLAWRSRWRRSGPERKFHPIQRGPRADRAVGWCLAAEPRARQTRLGIGDSDTDKMRVPKLSLTEAIGAFMEAAYGRRLDFEHA